MDEHPNTENISLSVAENDHDNDNDISTSSNNSSDDSQIPKVNDVDGYTQPIITSDKSQQNKILLASLLYHINQRKAKQQINNEKKHMITKNKYTNEELVSIIEQNTDNTELVLINFEDDTFRPVIKINEKYINIIKKWYETCNQLIDIEDTDIIIPKEININDISMILFKNMNCKHKDVFINEYIPKILNYIVLQNKIFNIESEMCISVLTTTSKVSIKKTQTLDELGITIPDNINYTEEYFYKKDKKISNYQVKKEPKSKPKLDNIGEISFNKKNDLHSKMLQKIDEDIDGCITIRRDNLDLLDISKIMSGNSIHKVQPRVQVQPDKYSIIQYLNDDGLTAYNNDVYGGGNYFSLEEEKAEKYENEYKEDLTKFKLIIVLINVINPLFFQTVTIVDPDLDTLTSVFEYTEYGFIELFTIKTDNDEIELFINKQYNGNIYNNSTEINESLVSTSQYIEFSNNKLNNNKQLLEEEKSVKHYLNTYYNITNDIEHKIKAKVLYDTLIKEKLCVIDKTKLAGFKNRLSNYLKELNLQKKRYSDGYYYYGIVKKEPENNIQENNKELRNITDIMEERNNLYREMTTNSNDFYRLK